MSRVIEGRFIFDRQVKDPKDYRWSGYGEAVAGKRERRMGLMKAFGPTEEGVVRDGRSCKRYQAFYRKYLYGAGEESSLDDEATRKRRGAHEPRAVAAVTGGWSLGTCASGACPSAQFHG